MDCVSRGIAKYIIPFVDELVRRYGRVQRSPSVPTLATGNRYIRRPRRALGRRRSGGGPRLSRANLVPRLPVRAVEPTPLVFPMRGGKSISASPLPKMLRYHRITAVAHGHRSYYVHWRPAQCVYSHKVLNNSNLLPVPSPSLAQLANALAEIRLDRGIPLLRQTAIESPMVTLSPRTLSIIGRTSFLPSVVL